MTSTAKAGAPVRLTANFTLDEFTASDTADRHGIKNTPTAKHEANIRSHTAPGLQLIRDKLGRAVVLLSGYRNPKVNGLVGGVPTSAHAEGFAGDIRSAGLSARALAEFIRDDAEIMALVDQVILETSRNVVHVSFDPRRRGQVLTQPGGPGTKVLQGIV